MTQTDLGGKVVYQIYVKSFQDSNGDGIGDLPGITSRLDYLSDLGVDYLWLTPIYPSPQRDNGYDVADYRAINPEYGTMQDFETLCAEAEKRGIRIMLDMVFNHTSTNHEWFRRALAGEQKYLDYYIWKDGVPGTPPTNWESKFGGSAWQWEERVGKYYLHLFDRTQADLNWENPEVRQELFDILHFWEDKGVRAFRFDVVNLISKPDVYTDDNAGDGRRFYADGPRIHEYLKLLNARGFGKCADVVTVGEMSSTSLENCVRYTAPAEGELSMVFSFHHLKTDYKNGDKWQLEPNRFGELKGLLDKWQLGMQAHNGWNAVFWCNHDQPRIVSRFGDEGQYHDVSAKMLGTAIHMLRGTPYIYQGEELGMTNAHFTDIRQYKDVESTNRYRILKDQGMPDEEIYAILGARSRDNGRTPMQWDGSAQGGFTTGTPWLAVNPNTDAINAAAEAADPDSVLNYYRRLVALRKEYPVIQSGLYAPVEPGNPNVYAYTRTLGGETLVVACNFYAEPARVTLPAPEGQDARLLIGNWPEQPFAPCMTLRPYEAVVYRFAPKA